MKFNTEITTRNWNNGWVDVNIRMPKDGDSCYILYSATLIDYDPKTLKSTWVKKNNGMGEADRENGTWTNVHSDYGCDRCWSQETNDFLNDYYYDILNDGKPCDGLDSDGKTVFSYGDSEIIDSDVFTLNPNRLYMLSKTLYPSTRKDGKGRKQIMQSVDFEILAWCSIPDEPINPFEKENNNN